MKKVVITGLGMVTPVGNGKAATWSALKAGKHCCFFTEVSAEV